MPRQWRRFRYCPCSLEHKAPASTAFEAQWRCFAAPLAYASRHAVPHAMQHSVPAGIDPCRVGVSPDGLRRDVSDSSHLTSSRTLSGARQHAPGRQDRAPDLCRPARPGPGASASTCRRSSPEGDFQEMISRAGETGAALPVRAMSGTEAPAAVRNAEAPGRRQVSVSGCKPTGRRKGHGLECAGLTGLDPANDSVDGAGRIRIAAGRDFSDVSPTERNSARQVPGRPRSQDPSRPRLTGNRSPTRPRQSAPGRDAGNPRRRR